jgi:hypothetical protein
MSGMLNGGIIVMAISRSGSRPELVRLNYRYHNLDLKRSGVRYSDAISGVSGPLF